MERSNSIFISISLLLLSLLLVQCAGTQDTAYIKEIDDWHKKRVERLKQKDSWFSLAGLFHLKEGINTFGSNKSNDLIFPEKAAPYMGEIILTEGKAVLKAKDGVRITVNDSAVAKMNLKSDADGRPTVLANGSFSWYVIKRGESFLVRLKDSENPAISEFTGIDRFKVDSDWRIKARFEEYNPAKKIVIPNVLGQSSEETCPGALVFEIDGTVYRLDPLAKSKNDNFFIIFSDETSARETYGAGRFLSAAKLDENGETFIDFNKAVNPPCAFSDYATCPLPPKQNHIPVEVTAGEKKYGHH